MITGLIETISHGISVFSRKNCRKLISAWTSLRSRVTPLLHFMHLHVNMNPSQLVSFNFLRLALLIEATLTWSPRLTVIVSFYSVKGS